MGDQEEPRASEFGPPFPDGEHGPAVVRTIAEDWFNRSGLRAAWFLVPFARLPLPPWAICLLITLTITALYGAMESAYVAADPAHRVVWDVEQVVQMIADALALGYFPTAVWYVGLADHRSQSRVVGSFLDKREHGAGEGVDVMSGPLFVCHVVFALFKTQLTPWRSL